MCEVFVFNDLTSDEDVENREYCSLPDFAHDSVARLVFSLISKGCTKYVLKYDGNFWSSPMQRDAICPYFVYFFCFKIFGSSYDS